MSIDQEAVCRQRRQILKLTGGPISRDDLLESLPGLFDRDARAEARENISVLITLEYLRKWQWKGTEYVQITKSGTRQLMRETTELDASIWGELAFGAGGEG